MVTSVYLEIKSFMGRLFSGYVLRQRTSKRLFCIRPSPSCRQAKFIEAALLGVLVLHFTTRLDRRVARARALLLVRLQLRASS